MNEWVGGRVSQSACGLIECSYRWVSTACLSVCPKLRLMVMESAVSCMRMFFMDRELFRSGQWHEQMLYGTGTNNKRGLSRAAFWQHSGVTVIRRHFLPAREHLSDILADQGTLRRARWLMDWPEDHFHKTKFSSAYQRVVAWARRAIWLIVWNLKLFWPTKTHSGQPEITFIRGLTRWLYTVGITLPLSSIFMEHSPFFHFLCSRYLHSENST